MTKRRTAILSGGVTILLAAYAVWCCRDFILSPRLAMGDALPDDMKQGIAACYHKAAPFPPSRVTFAGVVRAISNPYSDSRCEAFVIAFRDDFVGIETSRSEWCYLEVADGRWRMVDPEQLTFNGK